MLHIKIDLVPFGQEEGRRTISEIFIVNEGKILKTWFEYGVYRKDPRFKRERIAIVEHDQMAGAELLTSLALKEIYEFERNQKSNEHNKQCTTKSVGSSSSNKRKRRTIRNSRVAAKSTNRVRSKRAK